MIYRGKIGAEIRNLKMEGRFEFQISSCDFVIPTVAQASPESRFNSF
jgi:hypothetical protein